jgi:hypothetical protein
MLEEAWRRWVMGISMGVGDLDLDRNSFEVRGWEE